MLSEEDGAGQPLTPPPPPQDQVLIRFPGCSGAALTNDPLNPLFEIDSPPVFLSQGTVVV